MFKNGVALAADRNMCCERLDVHDGFLQVRPEWKLSDRGVQIQKNKDLDSSRKVRNMRKQRRILCTVFSALKLFMYEIFTNATDEAAAPAVSMLGLLLGSCQRSSSASVHGVQQSGARGRERTLLRPEVPRLVKCGEEPRPPDSEGENAGRSPSLAWTLN